MKPKTIPLASVRPNPDNPRYISKKEYAELVKSIKRDFLFLEEERLLHADGVWLSGNQRAQALTELSRDTKFMTKLRKHYGEMPDGHIPECWVSDVSRFTDAQKRRLAIVANSPGGLSGAWDFDKLANLPEWSDMPELEAWGLAPEGSQGNGSADGTEYGEDMADGVFECKCPTCGHKHASKN